MPEIQFSSLSDFLAMGGYARYVWASYGLFALFMAACLLQPRLERRRLFKQLRARLEREENA